MRAEYRRFAFFGAALLALPAAALAAPSLGGIMSQWSHDMSVARTMTSPRGRYQEGTMRAILENYIHNSAAMEARITRHTASAIAFRNGFVRVRTDAQAALADVAVKSRMAPHVTRILHDCYACHARFR